MAKGVLFFLVAIGIGLFLYYNWTPPTVASVNTEGFQASPPAGASPGIKIPYISPRDQTLLKGEVAPFDPPTSTLLAPPPGQQASVNSLPFEDPALEKAPAGRIKSVFESLSGFLTREAPGLQELGDPAVQLPLTTARADKNRLQDELAVLERNPGLQSSLTQEDIDGVEGNLGYLQKKWRLSVNASSSGGVFEGFEDVTGPKGLMGIVNGVLGLASTGPEGFQTGGGGSTDLKVPASLDDLTNLVEKINVEVIRLQASGSTDLNTQARIDTLSSIAKTISDMIDEIKKGVRPLSQVSITKTDIQKFLPVMSNVNTALPSLLGKDTQSVSKSLFPAYSPGDVSGSQVAAALFDKYADTVFKDLSWELKLKKIGKTEEEMNRNMASVMADARALNGSDTMAGAGAPFSSDSQVSGGRTTAAANGAYRGFMESVVSNMMGESGVAVDGVNVGMNRASAGAGTVASLGGSTTAPMMNARTSGSLDWKARAVQICEQVTKRGLDPKDYGCLPNPNSVPLGFSWRGYARMVCNRLATNYDPSVPELCGCPPPTWPGWRP
jgi:hypothetical protein